MSDNNNRNGFDDMNIRFPGEEPDYLTEEERSFSFEEDYLDSDFPQGEKDDPQWDQEPENDPPTTAALADVFRKMTSSVRNELAARREDSRRGEYKPHGKTERAPVTVGQDLRPDEMLVYDSELDDLDCTDEDDIPEMRDYAPIRFRRYGRTGIGGGILYGLFVISVSVVLACMLWMFASDVLALNKDGKNAVVVVEEYAPTGDMPLVNEDGQEIQVDIDQVASALKNADIIEYRWLFRLFSRFSHADVKIDPGTYDVSSDLDYRALVLAMQFGSGNQEITRITFPEGYNLEQIFTLLEENGICKKDELYETAANYEFDYDFLAELPYGDASRLEGYLFPDTYDFYQGEAPSVAISRFLRNMETKLTADMEVQASNLGISVRDAIIIASLIEKEAGADEERPIMASVIYNRLDAGMKLELDSTLNYIKGTSTFALTYDDMEIDSPYNTYLYGGLPAGPICSPGIASIDAALNPDSTDYWYWYAYQGETTFFTNSADFSDFAASHPYSE